VEGEFAALHRTRKRFLVEQLAADDAGAPLLDCGGGIIGARERDHVVSARDQPGY
jgi:hypothetical protein